MLWGFCDCAFYLSVPFQPLQRHVCLTALRAWTENLAVVKIIGEGWEVLSALKPGQLMEKWIVWSIGPEYLIFFFLHQGDLFWNLNWLDPFRFWLTYPIPWCVASIMLMLTCVVLAQPGCCSHVVDWLQEDNAIGLNRYISPAQQIHIACSGALC